MKEPSPMPQAVIDSVFKTHTYRVVCPNCEHFISADAVIAHRILREIYWDGLNGCYFFHLAGMTVGVETDGYMHT